VAAEDSHNVLPALLGQKPRRPLRDSMIVHSVDGIFAIRQGPWKYIEGKASVKRVPGERQGEATAQLYNLVDDPFETRDLIGEQLGVAARLLDALNTKRASGFTRAR